MMKNSLIDDMIESWGSNFQALNNAQRLWLIRTIALFLFEHHPLSGEDAPNDYEVSEVISRLDELNSNEMIGLLESLTAQIKNYN